MASMRSFSRMDLRARAPVPRCWASRAIWRTASSVTTRSTSSRWKRNLYCLMMAFFGSVRTAASWSSSSRLTAQTTGNRPTNSGISPKDTRSAVSTLASMSSKASARPSPCCEWDCEAVVFSPLDDDETTGERGAWACSRSSKRLCFRRVAPKPMEPLSTRRATIFSRPSKAPPQMKRMWDVSIWIVSRSLGFFRAPSLGTTQTQPSQIFSNACWTPSPETSLVIETFSPDFFESLSISST
mmetsp:Transcript_37663/g.120819  ORF Transcript_37663/g.120819 Transcript_37663/m.120819 type:complete len:241 (-) Transcript_37663:948-1670(-)